VNGFVRTIPQTKQGLLKYGKVPDHWTELEQLDKRDFVNKRAFDSDITNNASILISLQQPLFSSKAMFI
jgi:hypothetical protein